MPRQGTASALGLQAHNSTTRVSITLIGREYSVSCGDGEEDRLREVEEVVDELLQEISSRNIGISETRLFMLACLMIADEMLDLRRAMNEDAKSEENLMVAAVEHLRGRIASISSRISEQQK